MLREEVSRDGLEDMTGTCSEPDGVIGGTCKEPTGTCVESPRGCDTSIELLIDRSCPTIVVAGSGPPLGSGPLPGQLRAVPLPALTGMRRLVAFGELIGLCSIRCAACGELIGLCSVPRIALFGVSSALVGFVPLSYLVMSPETLEEGGEEMARRGCLLGNIC